MELKVPMANVVKLYMFEKLRNTISYIFQFCVQILLLFKVRLNSY